MKGLLDHKYGEEQFGLSGWNLIKKALVAYANGDYRQLTSDFFELNRVAGKSPVTLLLLNLLVARSIPDKLLQDDFTSRILGALAPDAWGRAVGEFLTGRRTAADLWGLVGRDAGRFTQFHFYSGELEALAGGHQAANRHYRLALAAPSTEMESWLALVAISRIRLSMDIPGMPRVGSMVISLPLLEDFVDPLDILERADPKEIVSESSEQVSQTALYHSMLGEMYWARGSIEEARKHFEAAVDCQRSVGGSGDDLWLAKMLNERAGFEAEQGNYLAAVECYKEVIQIVDKVVENPDQSFAGILSYAAIAASDLGTYAEAEQWYRRALELRRQHNGPESPSSAIAMDNLASVLMRANRHAEAEALYQQAGEIFGQRKEERLEDYAVNRAGLGKLYLQMGRHEDGLALIKESLGIYRTLFPEIHDRVATGYQSLGLAYLELGRYTEAEPVLRHAAQIRAELVGESHPDFASVLNNLSTVLSHLGKEEEALQLCERVVEITQQTLGPSSPNLALLLLNLAEALRQLGRNQEAASKCEEALRIIGEKAKASPTGGYALLKLGDYCIDAGDYRGAYRYYKEAQEVFRSSLPVGHKDRLMPAAFKLGELYEQVGQYQKAAQVYAEVDASLEFDRGHPFRVELNRRRAVPAYYLGDLGSAAYFLGQAVSAMDDRLAVQKQRVLSDLANVYATAGNERQAVECLQSAIKLVLPGDAQPGVVRTLTNLATVHLGLGEVERASEAVAEAARLCSERGMDMPRALEREQAILLEYAGKEGEAFRKLARLIEREEKWLENASLVASEAQRLSIIQTTRHALDLLITVYLDRLSQSDRARGEVLALLLRRKGIWAEMIGGERGAILEGKYPHLREKFELRRTLRLRIARARTSLVTSEGLSGDETKLISIWDAEKEQLEEALAREVEEIRISRLMQRVTPDTIQGKLPDGAVAVEWLRFRYGGLIRNGRLEGGRERYMAVVLSRQSVQTVVLDEAAAAIDQLIKEYRQRIGERSAAEQILGTQIREALWDPIEKLSAGPRVVFMCPDSSVSLIPFEVFPAADGKGRLIDRVEFRYLATARDLVREERPAKSLGQPLVIGDPRFNWPAELSEGAAGSPDETPAGELAVQRGADAESLSFNRLAETSLEAKEIARLLCLKKPHLWEEAVKDRVLTCRRPAVLHLATHGYALERRLAVSDLRFSDTTGRGDARRILPDDPHMSLTLVGLGFAGARTYVEGKQQPHPKCGNGLLSGAEVAELDLEGCQLCVISACDSGLGEVTAGQGVFSLARAFMFAGARTIILSLWRQDDEAARILMVAFYQYMTEAKQPKEVAFRRAQAFLRADARFADPYYWAGWLVIGQAGPLDTGGWSDPNNSEEVENHESEAGGQPAVDAPRLAEHPGDRQGLGHRPTLAASLKRKKPLPVGDEKWESLIHVIAGLADAGAYGAAAQVIEAYLQEEPSGKSRARALSTLADVLRLNEGETSAVDKVLDEAEQLAVGFDKGQLAFERGMLRARDGQTAEAERLLAESAEILGRDAGEDDPAYLVALIEWAGVLNSLGRHEEALHHLELIRGKVSEEDPYYFDFIDVLAEAYKGLGQPGRAELVMAEQIRVLGDRPGVYKLYQNRAAMLQLCGRLQEAEESARRATEISKRVFGENSDHSASAYHELGNVLAAADKHHEAAEAFRTSLEILEALKEVTGRNCASTKWTLALTLRELGQFEAAENELRDSLSIMEEYLGGPSYPDYWRARRDFAITLEHKGEYDQASEQFREIIRALDTDEPQDDEELLTAFTDLIFCLNASGRADAVEIEAIAKRQLAVAERAHGSNHEMRLDALNNLAGSLGAQGRVEDAEHIVYEALGLGRKLTTAGGRRQLLKSLIVLIQLKLLQQNPNALKFAREALELLESILDPSEPMYEEVRPFLLSVIEEA